MESYRKLCTEFYDLDKPEAPEVAIHFYLRYAEEANAPILEPMCGSGRFLIPLVARGFDVDGVDASGDMLDACRKKCESKGFRPHLYQQFIDQMNLPRQYSLAFIPAGSFGLIIEKDKVMESLKRIFDHLLPGGKFVLEVETPAARPTAFGQWRSRWIERPDGAKIVISGLSGAYDDKEKISRNLNRYEFFKDGKLIETELEEFTLRFYEPLEFQALLELGGFTGVRRLTYQNREPDSDDVSIVFECYKPEGLC